MNEKWQWTSILSVCWKMKMRNGENGINKLEILYWLVSRYIWPLCSPCLCLSAMYAYGADLLNYWSEKSGMSGAIWFKFFMSIEIFCWLWILFLFHSIFGMCVFFTVFHSVSFIFLWRCTFRCLCASLHSSCLFFFIPFHTTMKYHLFSGAHLINWSFVFGLVNLLRFSLLLLTWGRSVPFAVPNEKRILPWIRTFKKCYFLLCFTFHMLQIFRFLFAFRTVCLFGELIFIWFCMCIRDFLFS